ncbi:MAG: phage antirepressor protein [Odoribacter splanchnicus]|nr:phage antirepressor protein [Odoribacter splanchnicus]
MNELITITESNGKRAVSAKELYEKLGFAPQHWANWYKKNIINNTFAVENEDFIQLPLSGRTQDFALSIDFAKRLSMMARTETGEQIRNYFIEIEKRATQPLSQLEILAQSVHILQEQEKRLTEVEDRVKVIEAKQTTHQNWFTIAGYGTLLKIQVGIKLAANLGRKACNLCRQLGIEPEEIPDPRFGKVKTYPENVLKQVFNMPIN